MKLRPDQIDFIEQQIGSAPIPEDNPATQTLIEAFGDHTFYFDQAGLVILETVPEGTEDADPNALLAIKIAEWADDSKQGLRPMEPEVIGIVNPPTDDITD